jgi:uncharacterized GH25 family protein
MKRKLLVICLLSLAVALTAHAHDLFLKFDSYFLKPNSKTTVRLLNGTFRASEATVARERMIDVSIIKPVGERTHPPATGWRDEGNTSLLDLETGAAGTYVVGLSTKSRDVEQKAAAFNDYLAHDGMPDTLAERRKNKELDKDVRRRYSKYVKAIFQVGDERSDSYKTPLNYPVEIIPRQHPYSLKAGQVLEVLCLKDGQPLVNQFVSAGRELNGREVTLPSVRSDNNGIARIPLKGAGKWYVKFIQMAKLDDPQINYESKWATLTFEVK